MFGLFIGVVTPLEQSLKSEPLRSPCQGVSISNLSGRFVAICNKHSLGDINCQVKIIFFNGILFDYVLLK